MAATLAAEVMRSTVGSLDDRQVIACVIYAAKSTEDRRGSIPD
jgi:hypothetical protein